MYRAKHVSDWSTYATFPEHRLEALFGDRVVPCFADRPSSMYALFANGAAQNPGGEALVHAGKRWRYEEVDDQIAAVAAGLQERGLGPGARVALLMENSIEYVIILFAAAKMGAVSVPLNIRDGSAEIAHVIEDSGASLLICSATLTAKIAVKVNQLTNVEVIDLQSHSSLAKLISVDSVTAPAEVLETDTAVILYTSGTTGQPKGAMLSHVNLVHSAMQYRFAMEMSKDDRSVIAVPMSHVTGLVALILTVASAGACLIIMDEFKAERFVDIAASEAMTHTLLVPAMFALCLLRPDIGNKDLGRWRVSGYGGAIMPAATLARIAQILPQLQLINCYGATETTSPAAMMPPEHAADRAHQVGLPVICADVRVMDDEGREVAPNEDGEIWISGPMVVSGYWNNAKATAAEFVGGYWKSGDLGRKDERGFIQIVDRIKDIINRGGYKIPASEVENVILSYADVSEAAVVAKACPVLGERVHAFLVVEPTFELSYVADVCRKRLADYKVPEEFHIVDALPRNANGKVLKRMLRSELEARQTHLGSL